MTLFFNLEKVTKLARKDPRVFLTLLQNQYLKNTKYDPALVGKSYILNIQPLFYSKELDILHVVHYIQLAARRDYFLYKSTNFIALDTSYFPDLNMESVLSNPLLTLNNKLINFKYEEIYNGSKFWKHKRQGNQEVR